MVLREKDLDIYPRNTPSDVLPASGVYGDTYLSVYGEGGKGSLRIRRGGGGGFVMYGFIPFGFWGKISTGTLSCLLLRLQYLFIFLSNVFLFFMYILIACNEFKAITAWSRYPKRVITREEVITPWSQIFSLGMHCICEQP